LSPDFPCATPPTQIPFSCTSPGPVRLDVDAKDGDKFGPKTYDMVVRLPADAAAGAFSNCADVLNDNVPTGQSCVSVQTKPAPPATPADLAVTKTAMSQTCGEAKPCDFKITVTNKSSQAYTGNISVFDLMAADAAPMTQYKLASSPASPWVCIGSAAPGMQCNRPGPLAAGASVDLLLSLQPLPGSLGDAKYVNNCANIDGQQSAAKSCAQIAVEKPVAPPTAQCSNGMQMANGICACPANTKWNGQTCQGQGSGGADMSKPIDDTPVPVVTPQPLTCKFGMQLNANGFCACPGGMKWNGASCVGTFGVDIGNVKPTPPPSPVTTAPPGVPVQTCPADRPNGSYPNCCPNGTTYANGACRRPVVIPALCAPGMIHDRATGKCVSCPQGTISRADVCVRVQPQVCPADRPNGTYPNCCPAGLQYDNHGRCRPPRQYCGPNQFLDPVTNLCVNRPQQQKVCPPDRPSGNYPLCCPANYQYVAGNCVPTRVTCQDGSTAMNYAQCRIRQLPPPAPPPQPQQPQITCPDGRVVTGYWMCRINRQRPPPPVVHNCPPGYRVLTTPNKYGAYCEIIPVTPPTPTKPPPAPPPAQPKCNSGMRFDPQAGPGGSCVLDVR